MTDETTVHGDETTVHEGITYAERESGDLKLDLYLPDSENPRPTWSTGSTPSTT